MIGFWTRLTFGFRCFFAILFSGVIPQDIANALVRPTTTTTKPEVLPRESDSSGAVQMLALLQRDGRLIDFLEEDVAPYPDAQLGAAVRSIHTACRQVLERYFKIEPVMNSEEDQPVTVPEGFDPSAIKLIGNVSGKPPLRGLLRHRGWRVMEASLPTLPLESARAIVAPAEVEIP